MQLILLSFKQRNYAAPCVTVRRDPGTSAEIIAAVRVSIKKHSRALDSLGHCDQGLDLPRTIFAKDLHIRPYKI